MSFRPRLDILPPAQRELWPQLKPLVKLGLVLYGGTAIALRIGHRHSVDFDFFTEKPLDKAAIMTSLPCLAAAKVLQDAPNAYTALITMPQTSDRPVQVSFFGTIGFGRFGKAQRTEDGVVCAASLDDLMGTKLKVILQRAEAKDYQDIAAMLRAGVALDRGLGIARQMFQPNFQPTQCLKALNYFNDGDLGTLAKADREILISTAHAVGDIPEAKQLAASLAPRSPSRVPPSRQQGDLGR
ncbi:conserved hypothetical protein [Thiomonas sp. X19]|nr:conserved hypothetical protein [Thiomonas sp. X19]